MDRTFALCTAVAVLLTWGCEQREPALQAAESLDVTPAPTPAHSRPERRPVGVMFLLYEQQIPRFGGFFPDTNGIMRVVLTDTTRIEAARALLMPFFMERWGKVH